MRITFICCPFKTSYGWYGASLKAAIEKKTGTPVQWVGSNCGCGDPISDSKQFVLRQNQYDYFEMLMPGYLKGHRFRDAARTLLLYIRAKRYVSLSRQAEVVHFQQTLNGYGSKAVFHWLHQKSKATRIVTVHELDADQQQFPERSRAYNLADGVIVHCEEMKQRLVALSVQEEKIHIVCHGVDLPVRPGGNERDGIVFYGGHHLNASKGTEAVFKAISIIKQKMGASAPKLKIHGYYGMDMKEQAIRLAETLGVAEQVVWLDQVPWRDLAPLYQRSRVCMLPYNASFAGLAASLAAACELPVVATRKAGLPEHLGEAGIWVDENNPQQLASKTLELLNDTRLAGEVGARLRKRAERWLSWDRIADRTLEVYEESMRKKSTLNRASEGAVSDKDPSTSQAESELTSLQVR